jgi:hypothetical protein
VVFLSRSSSRIHLLSSEPAHRVEIVEALINAPVRNLCGQSLDGPGVYALLYRGEIECYKRLRRRPGPASIVMGGGYPLYVGSASRSLRARTRDHARKLATATDLSPDDFGLIELTTGTAASALYAEAILLEELSPIWNMRSICSGFGRKSPGTVRSQAAPPPWSRFHQDESSCADFKSELAAKISEHLEATVSTAAAREILPRPALALVEASARV